MKQSHDDWSAGVLLCCKGLLIQDKSYCWCHLEDVWWDTFCPRCYLKETTIISSQLAVHSSWHTGFSAALAHVFTVTLTIFQKDFKPKGGESEQMVLTLLKYSTARLKCLIQKVRQLFVCAAVTAEVAAEPSVPATSSWRWSSTRTWWTSSTLWRLYATANPTWWSRW